MIKLKCHRKDGSLIDIIDIRSVIIKIATITEWMIAVEWCTGENASEIDKTALNPIFLNDAEFVEYYKGITQTIDGHFAIESNFGHIEASIIDSSYWEIECENIKVINQIKSEMKENKSAQQLDASETMTQSICYDASPQILYAMVRLILGVGQIIVP